MAIKTYEEILKVKDDFPEIFSYLAMSYYYAGNYTEAEKIALKGIERFPDSADLHFNIAVIYEKSDRFDDMVRHLKKVIKINPNHADAINYLGYSYAEKEIKLDEALSLINEAIKLKPDSPYIIDSLGWVYFKLGRYSKAVEQLNKSISIVGDDPVMHEHLGDVYEAMSNKTLARESWKNALKHHEKEEGLKERVQQKIDNLDKKTN